MNRRAASAVGTGVLLLALLSLAALAAGQKAPQGGGPARAHGLPRELFDYAWTFGIAASVPLLVLLLYARARAPSRPSVGRRRYLAVAAVLAAGLAIVLAFHLHWRVPDGLGQRAAPPPTLNGEDGARSAARDGRDVRFKWVPLLVVLGAGGAIGGAWLLVARRPRPGPGLAAALAAALEVGIDDLRGESDARRAVIAAYARMERALASRGVPRSPAEAPLEYLARVLGELHVRPGAVLDLTQLFERAKFSPHEIDAAMKEESIAALEAVREDLA